MKEITYRNVDGFQTEFPIEKDIISSPGHVYIRKNIKKVEATSEIGAHYNYDEACLTTDEYREYQSEMKSPAYVGLMQIVSDIQADLALLQVKG